MLAQEYRIHILKVIYMTQQIELKEIKIEKKVFFSAVIVLGILIILSGILTFVLPAGEYEKDLLEGRETLVEGTWHATTQQPAMPWRWLSAPIEVLSGEDGLTIVVISLLLLFLSASFSLLMKSGALEYVVSSISYKFKNRKYLLLWVVSLFFMGLGSFLGIFEETVLLAPMAVALAVSIGFDVLTGLFISTLATGLGFAAGVYNPFTTGVAQHIAGIPVFSGAWLRMVIFVVVYLLLMVFTLRHAHKVDTGSSDVQIKQFSEQTKRSAMVFGIFFTLIICWIILAALQASLADYTMPVLAILFLSAGMAAAIASGLKTDTVLKTAARGMLNVLPGVLLILMASSIKYLLANASVLETVLYYAEQALSGLSPTFTAFGIYIMVLILEFFIGSGSAKAFLVMPLITPLASIIGLSANTAVLAFLCGDGFSNVFYVTNPVLLITLGITGVSYIQWVKKTWLLQLIILLATAGIIALAAKIGY